MKGILKSAFHLLYDVVGEHTSRKIVVIESDDWGGIRIPNKTSLKSLPSHLHKHYQSVFNQIDTIASPTDLEALFGVLNQVTDKNGNCAKLTANTILSNPDFSSIKRSEFNTYSSIPFTQTLEDYYGSKTFDLWKEGIQSECFHPQLHGLEHVDRYSWLRELKSGNSVLLDAFDRGIFSVDYDLGGLKKNLTAALDSNNELESKQKAKLTEEACKIFENVFGYNSNSFIAPSYTWDERIEEATAKNGVKLLQGVRLQKKPTNRHLEFDFRRHYFGEKNAYGQKYLVRNVFFEPSSFPNRNNVDDAMSRINLSFKLKRPAIIGMHRINVIGAIDEKNRTDNLNQLKTLLLQVRKKWPDVEFMTTSDLLDLKHQNN